MLSPSVVFLVDVDNTLLDNDRFADDLTTRLTESFGPAQCQRYWALYNTLRDELQVADYLGALQRFRIGLENDPALLDMSAWLLEYPFEQRLYPDALASLAHLRTLGHPVILSDGDVVFQPRKVRRAGLWQAVQGDVLIYVHKQQMLDAVQARYPANHYVMVDDKPNILADMKRAMGPHLTTVFVRQGHYAAAAAPDLAPPPDVVIAHISELRTRSLDDFLLPQAAAQ